MNIVCAWCGQVLGHKSKIALGQVSHGICEECTKKINQELHDLKKKQVPVTRIKQQEINYD